MFMQRGSGINKSIAMKHVFLFLSIVFVTGFTVIALKLTHYVNRLNAAYRDYQVEIIGDSAHTYNFDRYLGAVSLGKHGIDSVIRADIAENK